MSSRRCSDQYRLYNKPIHRRKDSGELDVFEATMYYYDDGTNNVGGFGGRKTMREELQIQGGRRMSLDMNLRNVQPPPVQQSHQPRVVTEKQHIKEKRQYKQPVSPGARLVTEKQQTKEKRQYKQPVSPGARLASFLNSLFNQKASRKKKSKSTTESVIDEEGSSMRRRSSVSHLGSLWTTDSMSRRSSSSSGLRSPPSYAKNTSKSANKDLRGYNSDHPKKGIRDVSSSMAHPSLQDRILLDADQKRKNMDLAWLDEKLKLIDGLSEKKLMSSSNGSVFKKGSGIWLEDVQDDGDGESDSSSDLFELQNYDLGLYSNGLPVYETTHIESIKRTAVPISNAQYS